MTQHPPRPTLFPYTTLFRSEAAIDPDWSMQRTTSFFTDRERSEEHTSELQSRRDLVCRLLLEKKKQLKEPDCEFSARGRSYHQQEGGSLTKLGLREIIQHKLVNPLDFVAFVGCSS